MSWLTEKEKEERDRILKEIRTKKQDNPLLQWKKRMLDRYRSVYETKKVLSLAGYMTADLENKSINTVFNLMCASMIGVILYRKTTRFRTFVQVVGSIYISNVLSDFYSIEQGLYKQALFASDQRSQEIRLLLNYYHPRNKYNNILVKHSVDFQQG